MCRIFDDDFKFWVISVTRQQFTYKVQIPLRWFRCRERFQKLVRWLAFCGGGSRPAGCLKTKRHRNFMIYC